MNARNEAEKGEAGLKFFDRAAIRGRDRLGSSDASHPDY
jgi:hypothetical protein